MAASSLPPPGSEYGPCRACTHTDCQLTRNMAETLCAVCETRIGYDVPFYRVDAEPANNLPMVHAACQERLIASLSSKATKRHNAGE